MFRTIKNKVLAFFSIFTLISFLIVGLNLYQTKLTNNTININKSIDRVHIRILDEFRCMDHFFSIELINSNYYSTHKSIYILQKDSINNEVKNLLKNKYKAEFENFNILHETVGISEKMDSLNIIFDEINRNLLIRGFKDFGKEGEMRNYIHSAESNKYADLITILSLRRHEKDYIIRNEQKYIVKLNDLASNYLTSIKLNRKIPLNEKDSLLKFISNYLKCFNEIVKVDNTLGIKNFSGLRKKFETKQNQILTEFLELKEKVITESKSRQNSYVITYLFISSTILIFSIILSIFISRVLTRRITKLSLYINEYVISDFSVNGKLKVKIINDEIGALISNFEILKENLAKHIHNLEEIVQERTLQLKKQNNDIISSITYAKNIQEALLPDRKYFETYFPESLVYFKPRSIVSGDFYWFKRFDEKNISVIAVADCTGHGVPGAMMSMLGIAYLNEIVVRQSVQSAAQILTELRTQVIEHLNNNQKSFITDGMDISVLVFFHDKQLAQFAGAKRDLLLFRNNLPTIFKGNKHTIGKSPAENAKFTNHEFEVKNDDIFYMLTDGFQDQFGALSKRTLQRNMAYDFFKEINGLNFHSQLSLVQNFLSYWQKDEPQTDDILILGFKYSTEIFQKHSIEMVCEDLF